jgi:hypothetical protein
VEGDPISYFDPFGLDTCVLYGNGNLAGVY